MMRRLSPRRNRRFRLTAMAVIGLMAAFWVRSSLAQPARAATADHAARGARVEEADPLLGALSFGSSREPISVTAESLDFDYRSRVITYRGKVVATQGDMELQSQLLTVALDDGRGDRLKTVVAEGGVRLSKGSRWATGGRAVFDQTKRTVVLSEDAVLHDGPNQVSGERVVVYLDEQRSVVEGGEGRVKAVLYPPDDAAQKHAGGGTP
jgi:lipopolysaccharide export system protein LptA